MHIFRNKNKKESTLLKLLKVMTKIRAMVEEEEIAAL